jgi:hypothetical protein
LTDGPQPQHRKRKNEERIRMFAQINHFAMVSPQWPFLARFYEALFGLQPSTKVSRPFNAATVGDGYVGLNINPLRDGGIGGLDHFGMVVDDVELALDRMKKKFSRANIIKRPSTRPFAAYSGHDPDCNIFDLAEKNSSKLSTVYAEQAEKGYKTEEQPKRILNKFAGPDHIGFKVESIEQLKEDIGTVTGRNSYLAPMPLGGHTESNARKAFLEKLGGKFHLADPSGTWIVVDE